MQAPQQTLARMMARQLVRWIDPPDPDRFVSELIALGETLLLGS